MEIYKVIDRETNKMVDITFDYNEYSDIVYEIKEINSFSELTPEEKDMLLEDICLPLPELLGIGIIRMTELEQEYQEWILNIDNEDSDRYDFLCEEKWGFCGCGCHKDAVLAVKEMLDWCGEDIASRKSPSEFTNYQKFMLYFLDNKGYTEHGGSVNGSWLEDDGRQVLEFINYALKEEEKDENTEN